MLSSIDNSKWMINDSMLERLLQAALLDATREIDFVFVDDFTTGNAGLIHRQRSSRFLAALHTALARELKDQNCTVFSKAHRNSSFMRSEYLYDIMVAEVATIHSPFSGGIIHSVTRAVLQVESELALKVQEAMIDFSKLLCGLADYKLMIMPFYRKSQNINNWLMANVFTDSLRERDKAAYYLCYVEHPKYWRRNELPLFELYLFDGKAINNIVAVIGDKKAIEKNSSS